MFYSSWTVYQRTMVSIFAPYVILKVSCLLRPLMGYLVSKYCRKRIGFAGTSSLRAMCFAPDIGFFLTRTNDSHYVREVEFAWQDFFLRSGIDEAMKHKKGYLTRYTTTVMLREPIPLFSFYVIKTRICGWNPEAIFIEHRIEDTRGMLRGIAMCEMKLTGGEEGENLNDVFRIVHHVEGRYIPWVLLSRWLASNVFRTRLVQPIMNPQNAIRVAVNEVIRQHAGH